jgi:hypothetical protein
VVCELDMTVVWHAPKAPMIGIGVTTATEAGTVYSVDLSRPEQKE